MYIRTKEGLYRLGAEGLGDASIYTPWRDRLGLRSKAQYLRFLNLDKFGHNKFFLTHDHRNMLDYLVKHVEASWKTTRPISVIRLVGHTDNTGASDFNVKFGNLRAKAVAEALRAKLRTQGLSNGVAIVVEQSPGESTPTADNRTKEGRAANRRVEVFIRMGVLPLGLRPTSPIDLSQQAQDAARRVEEEAERRRQEQIYNKPIPTRTPGKSLSDWCHQRFGHRICDRILNGGCDLLEEVILQSGGILSEDQKEDFRKQCREAAKRPI